MKKVLLTLFIGAAQMGFSQTSCANALEITANGTTIVPAYTGTYVGTCAGSGEAALPFAMWYKYTPVQNGEITVTSDLPQNDGLLKSDDTRLSIISGTCTALTCYGGNDDVSATNYLSAVTYPVVAGTTYYIVWDNRWSDLGFDFNFSFNAVTCIRPHEYDINAPSDITVSGANLSWDAALGTPSSYDVQYGVSGFTLGTGTIQNTTNTNAVLTGLTAGANYSYYLRSNCGVSQSPWVGPFSLYLAKTAPYSNSFEQPELSNGFSGTGWSLSNAAGHAQNGTIFYFSNTSTTAVSNSQLYSRALSFTAGESVSFNFWTKSVSATQGGTIKMYYNTTRSLAGAIPIGADVNVSGTTYTQHSRSFVVPTAGTYYIIFSNESPITTAVTSLAMDNFTLTSVLGTDEINHQDVFVSVYPNPVSDILNIKTKEKVQSASVFDMSGRKIEAKVMDNAVDVTNLEKGTYIINIQTEKGTTSEKFIKK